MEAARLHAYTHEMDDALSFDTVDAPQPTHPTHVVVRVAGAGWCQTDNHIIEGMWDTYVDQPLPMTLGHENAGEAVTTVTEGDQVICHPQATCGVCRPCRQGEDMYCEAINDVLARLEAAKNRGPDGDHAALIRRPRTARDPPVARAPRAASCTTAARASPRSARS